VRRLLAIGLLLAAASVAAGQAVGERGAGEKPACGMTAAEAPDVKGLRLGLTTQHVFELFPGSADDPDIRAALSATAGMFGAATFIIKPEAYASNSAYAGVNNVLLRFVEGRLSSFTVGFSAHAWPHVDEFVSSFTKGTGLPPADAWEPYVGLDTQLKILTCEGFEVRAFAGGKNVKFNYVKMTDTAAERKLKERREKARKAAPRP
jgi:hypothetical protein